jgi:hypothetical protein
MLSYIHFSIVNIWYKINKKKRGGVDKIRGGSQHPHEKIYTTSQSMFST